MSRRKKNPYATKQKMQNIASDLWKYRGYEIKTQRGPWGRGSKPRSVATLTRVDPDPHAGYDALNNRQFSHEDEVALLELVRLRIDRDLYLRGLSEKDQRDALEVESEIEFAFHDVHSGHKKPVTRANISRQLEVIRDEAKGILGPKGHIRVRAFEFFDSLPLKDRLSWVDARIKELKIDLGLPLTNPRKKAKKKASRRRRNPYDTKHKMQNIGSDLWKYRGFEIKVSRKKGGGYEFTLKSDTRVSPDESFAALNLSGRNIVVKDEVSGLEVARLLIDRWNWIGTLGEEKTAALQMNDVINWNVDAATGGPLPLNRGSIARQIEVGRRQATISDSEGRKAYDFFYRLPIKDRVSWIDSNIRMSKLILGLPLTNPSRRFTDEEQKLLNRERRRRRRLSPEQMRHWLSPEGEREIEEGLKAKEEEMLRKTIRAIVMGLHQKGKQISRAAVARGLQEEFDGWRRRIGAPQTSERTFNAMPVSERVKLLDTEISEYKAKHGITNPRKKAKKKASRRRVNPYETKKKMRNIASDIWRYGPYQIDVSHVTKPAPGYKAEISRVDPPLDAAYLKDDPLHGSSTTHKKEAYALELVRLYIDEEAYAESLSKDDRAHYFEFSYLVAREINRLSSSHIDGAKRGDFAWLNRAALARILELEHKKLQGKERRGKTAEAGRFLPAFDFFNAIPVKSRLAWLDSNIKMYKLKHGIPLTNPRKKAKKKMLRRKKVARTKGNPEIRHADRHTLVAVKDLPPKLKKAIRENFKGREVGLEVASTFDAGRIQSNWSYLQGYITVVNLLTGKYTTEFGRFGGGSGLPGARGEARVDAAKGDVDIPMNSAVIIGGKGHRPMESAIVIARPENMTAFLPGKVDLTPYETLTFYILEESRGEKSRQDNYRSAARSYPGIIDTFKDSVKSLQEKGLIKISKNGRVTFSTAGKNHKLPWGRNAEFKSHEQYMAHHGIVGTGEKLYIWNPDKPAPKKAKKKMSRRKNPWVIEKHGDHSSLIWQGDGPKPPPSMELFSDKNNKSDLIDGANYIMAGGEGLNEWTTKEENDQMIWALTVMRSELMTARNREKWTAQDREHVDLHIQAVDETIANFKKAVPPGSYRAGEKLGRFIRKAKKKMSRRKKNPEDWDFTEAKRRLRKARHALENADRGGYRGEGVASRGSILSDYTRAYQEAALGVFILNRMIFLDIDASRAKRALWVHSAKGVMQGEGEALDVFWNTTEAVFRQCGIRITPEMKGTLSLHFIGSVSKDLQSWKARPTGGTILPSPEDLNSWLSAASLTITKWKHGQKPRMKREEQILFLLDVLASTFIIATAAPKLQPRGQREKDKAPRLLIPAIALGIDAQDLLAAECKEGQRERARVKHAKGRGGNPKKAPTAKELVAKCQKLWEAYCKRPGVTKLRAVAKHCEAMKASKAKSATKERQACMRSIRAEAKTRGWKL